MAIDHYLLYMLIAVGYIASPGPAVFIAINSGFAIGAKRTMALLAGNTAGIGALAFISAVGIGAFILRSATLTAAVKVLGALWLTYLGINMMRPPAAISPASDQTRLRKLYAGANWFSKFRDGLILALTNPKPIVFFVSIYPQFIIADGFAARQLFLLGVTFMLLSFGILNFYSVLSAALIKRFLGERKIRLVNYCFGGMFLLLALLLLMESWRLIAS